MPPNRPETPGEQSLKNNNTWPSNGELIAHLRLMGPFSLREVSNITGISIYTLHAAETGKRKPRPSTIRKVITALEPRLPIDRQTLDDLLQGKQSPEAPQTAQSLRSMVLAYRLNAGLSKRGLAAKSGIAASTIAEIEKRQHNPHPSTTRRLAQAINVGLKPHPDKQ